MPESLSSLRPILEALMRRRSQPQPPSETTQLPPVQEALFQRWLGRNKITDADPASDHYGQYDYRGFWKENPDFTREPGQHFTDKFKQRGHGSFSVESKYSRGLQDGGQWLENRLGELYAGGPRVRDTLVQPPMPSHGASASEPDDYIGSILRKATGISRRPPDPGEQMFGERWGKPLDDFINTYVAPKDPDVLDLAATIPLGRMFKLFETGGMAERLLAKTPSRILQMEGHPDIAGYRSGSRGVAQVASGTVPWSVLERQAELSGTGVPRYEKELAQDELYRITQQLLDHLGISSNESVQVFRGGPLYRPGYRLTPTSVDEQIARDWSRSKNGFNNLQLSPYEVPRKSIRALAGILSRGDDITLSEMLIPSSTLAKSKVGTAYVGIEPGGDILRGVSGRRLRRETARMGK